MNLKKLRQEIEFLKAEEDQAVTHLVGATARDKLQGIKQTLEVIDKLKIDDWAFKHNLIQKDRIEWDKMMELLK